MKILKFFTWRMLVLEARDELAVALEADPKAVEDHLLQAIATLRAAHDKLKKGNQ